MIAALLMITSIIIIGALETRSDGEVDTGPELAFDRTESAVQGELRGAIVDATHRAAAQPVMNSDYLSGDDGSDELFENYVKLLIYKETHERLEHASQDLGDQQLTEVEFESPFPGDRDRAIDNAEEKIEITGPNEAGVPHGTIEVTFTEDIVVTVEEDGQEYEERMSDLTVTVGTPIFELKEKTDEYEAALDGPFFDEDMGEGDFQLSTLAQHSALRIYPMAYMMSGMNRLDPGRDDWTFDEILAHDRMEVLINDAVFSVQEGTFGDGVHDPYQDRVMNPAWVCLAADIAVEIAEREEAEDDSVSEEITITAESSETEIDDASVVVDGEHRGTGAEVTFDWDTEVDGRYGDLEIHTEHYEPYETRVNFDTTDEYEAELEEDLDDYVVWVMNDNNPTEAVYDAEVVHADDGAVGYTTSAGVYDFTGEPGDYELEISAQGYQDETFDVSFSDNDPTEIVRLTPTGDDPKEPDDGSGIEDDIVDDGAEDHLDSGEIEIGGEVPQSPEEIQELLCGPEFREYIFGGADGELPDAPDPTDIFGSFDPMQEEEEITAEPFAQMAYYQTVGESDVEDALRDELPGDPDDILGGDAPEFPFDDQYDGRLDDVIDEIYEVDVERSINSGFMSYPETTDREEVGLDANYTHDESTYEHKNHSFELTHHSEGWESDDEYHDIELHTMHYDVEVGVEEKATFVNESDDSDTHTFTFDHVDDTSGSIAIDADHDFTKLHPESRNLITVDRNPIAHDFVAGGENSFDLASPHNFESVRGDSLEDTLTVSISDSDLDDPDELKHSIETNLRTSVGTQLRRSTNLDSPHETVASAIARGNGEEDYDFHQMEGGIDDMDDFEEWLSEDLSYVRERVEAEVEPQLKERIDYITEDEPYDEIEDNIRELEDEFVTEPFADGYENVPELVKAQSRAMYFEMMYYWVDDLNDQHNVANDIADEIDDMDDGMMDDALGFIQDLLAGEAESQAGNMRGSPLLEEMEFEVAGSPTYLDLEPLDTDQVPAIRPSEGELLDDQDASHAALGAYYDQRIKTPGLPLIPWPPALYFLQFNTANYGFQGEYARFEVSATAGDATSGEATTFVRDDLSVSLEFGGDEEHVGETKPITFDSSVEVLIFMPGAVPMQAGAPPNTGNPEFGEGHTDPSEGWESTGPQG